MWFFVAGNIFIKGFFMKEGVFGDGFKLLVGFSEWDFIKRGVVLILGVKEFSCEYYLGIE